jgi:hypothetical protein
MSIKDIKPTIHEIESGEFPSPQERLREVAAEIWLKCEAEWKERILDHLSVEELEELLKDEKFCLEQDLSFTKCVQYELRMRKSLARAIEVGMPYCVYHDCKTTDCPDRPDGHLDEE